MGFFIANPQNKAVSVRGILTGICWDARCGQKGQARMLVLLFTAHCGLLTAHSAFKGSCS